jgi:hypothetical protein
MTAPTEKVQMDEGRRSGQYLVDHKLHWHLPEQVRRIGQLIWGAGSGCLVVPRRGITCHRHAVEVDDGWVDVYARFYSCRQCWASKCRGLLNSSKFTLSGSLKVYRTQGGRGQRYPSQATLQLRYKKSLVSPTHLIYLPGV